MRALFRPRTLLLTLSVAPNRREWVRAGLVLLLLGATIGSANSWGEEAAATGYANPTLLVSAQELANSLEERDLRILDARPPERYAAGHIPGAVNLPIAEITRTRNGVPGMLAPTAAVEQALGQRGVTREAPVVIYDDFGGIEATRLFWALEYLGHPRLSLLQGGIALWQRDGRATSQTVPTPKPARYQGEPRPDRLADRVWVQHRLQDPAVVLVDARSPEEFTGEIPGRDVRRPGHIPGAVNVDWVLNLTASEPRQFKAGTDLVPLYRQAGVTPDNEVAVYCRTGVRASHDYFVLRLLGYPRVRLYDGSYVEWAADATLPVER
ncbi:MAG TPA: sulfurtransferase [Alphaproteobacteria bacterium]|nr:sulfurtransferase [Alphaproteobacteria bacterium]